MRACVRVWSFQFHVYMFTQAAAEVITYSIGQKYFKKL